MNLKPGDTVPKPNAPGTEDDIVEHWGKISATNPVVSVICHTFNHQDFISDALNGFLMQVTDFPFEIIVHDDASTDETQSVLQEYAAKFPDIIKLILQKQNQFSRGLKPHSFTFPAAQGRYIALCEGDDFWFDQGKLQKQFEYLESHAECALVYGDSVAFENQKMIDKDFGGARRDLSSDELSKMSPIFTLTTCFRNVVDVPPEANIVGYGDLFLWARLAQHGSGAYLPDLAPAFYRVHGDGIHSAVGDEERRTMRLRTIFGMYCYFWRKKNGYLENYYKNMALEALLEGAGVDMRFLSWVRTATTARRRLGRVRRRLVSMIKNGCVPVKC